MTAAPAPIAAVVRAQFTVTPLIVTAVTAPPASRSGAGAAPATPRLSSPPAPRRASDQFHRGNEPLAVHQGAAGGGRSSRGRDIGRRAARPSRPPSRPAAADRARQTSRARIRAGGRHFRCRHVLTWCGHRPVGWSGGAPGWLSAGQPGLGRRTGQKSCLPGGRGVGPPPPSPAEVPCHRRH